MWAATLLFAPEENPISRVRCTLDPPSIILGQRCQLRIVVEPADPSIQVAPPKFPNARLIPAGVETEGRSRIHKFWVIPGGIGSQAATPARARLGPASRASNAIRLNVQPLPGGPQPSTFRGGIGPIQLSVRAEPARITLGQPCELHITLEGNGAYGSSQAPLIEDGPELIRMDWQPETPDTRTFIYRWTPKTTGTALLAPIRISWYDPATRRFAMAVSTTPTVEVIRAERFRLAEDSTAPPHTAESSSSWAGRTIATLAAISGAALLATAFLIRSRRPPSLTAEAQRLARRLAPNAPPEAIVDAFAGLLKTANPGISLATLTPHEAAQRADQLGLDREWTRDLQGLLADCDRARFAATPGQPAGDQLAGRARMLLNGIRFRIP